MFGMGKTRAVVGLDIGSSSIKVVELKRTGKEIEVVRLGLEPLAPEIVVDGAIVDTGQVSNTIARLFTDTKIRSKNVATSISGHSVIVKKLGLQPMTEEELEGAIQMEAAQNIPFDIGEVNLDYQVLDTPADSPTMDVLLVAVKKDKILNYTNVVTLAGKVPSIVDIDAFALQNAYEFNYAPAPDVTVALLNVGASVMNINIVKGRTPLFTRDVSVGGNQYTDTLQKELDLGFDEAETLKTGAALPGVSDEARLPVLKSVSEIIVLEIQRTFDFFRATAAGEQIRKIYLAGGSARVYGLTDLLQQELGLPVEQLDPLHRIRYENAGAAAQIVSANPPRLAVAIGLALRSFEDL